MRSVMILAAVALAGCADTAGGGKSAAPAAPAVSEYRAITTADEFNQKVVGKRLNYKDADYFTIRADGTLDGDFSGPMVGNWRWEDGYWCRTLVTPARVEDCQLWETDGTTLRATRGKGEGISFVYTM